MIGTVEVRYRDCVLSGPLISMTAEHEHAKHATRYVAEFIQSDALRVNSESPASDSIDSIPPRHQRKRQAP